MEGREGGREGGRERERERECVCVCVTSPIELGLGMFQFDEGLRDAATFFCSVNHVMDISGHLLGPTAHLFREHV